VVATRFSGWCFQLSGRCFQFVW